MTGPVLQWIVVEVAEEAESALWPYFMRGVEATTNDAEADYACTVRRPTPRGAELLFRLTPRLLP